MRRLGQFLTLLLGLAMFGPLMVSILAGLVAMFAAFAGLDELKVAAGAVCGAGASIFVVFLVLMGMGGSDLLIGLGSFQSKPKQPGTSGNDRP